ncbi:ribosome biogenesis protein BOP1 homolog isoform X1 [Zootermopsis nevadensis]|nr:ribosome biogenesis protein BOP1 homolog isoform X1 [Zootermopsis nevadensis]XP_021925491.1 ribosome biogenesis protein BOP1 homolog isoform X1 [Zootermopsis nevadensis]
MAAYGSGIKRKFSVSLKNDNTSDTPENLNDTSDDEHFLSSVTNDEDSSDADDDHELDESDEDDDVEGESGSEDSGASSLGKETTTKDEDYESDSDYSEYGSEEIDQEEERSAEGLEGSEVSYEDEVKESDQLKLLFKMKRTCSSKIKKSNTENSSNISQITSKNKIFNKERQVDENETTKQIDDEYKSDSSDEEDIRSTVGNIPMNWYDDYTHLGYDWDAKKVMKPLKQDELDSFLKRMEDPNFWRTVRDPQTGQDVVLCDADVDIIQRLQAQKIPDANFDDAAPWVEWFTSEVMKTPIVRVPDHKRSFLPSRVEARKVAKMVHAIKMGWMKPQEEKKESHEPKFFMLWQTDEGVEHMRRIQNHIPAPKRHLPGHAESYNPPPEYLFDKRELKEWNKLRTAPWKRKLHFVPQKYNSLRSVPAYDRFVNERFQRCLDLYLCPRARKMRLTIEPEDLLPQLPNPKDLQPFPTVMSMVYEGHTDMVRSIAVEPKGQYMVSGSDDLTVKVWEISTGRCVRTIPVGGIVRSVSWCPNQALSLIAVAADRKVLLVNPGVGDHLICSKTDSLLDEAPEQDVVVSERVKTAVQWEQASEDIWKNGIRIIISHFKEVRQVTWHGKGDYFATVMPEGQNRSVVIHQLSKRRSQVPFSKSKGLVQCVLFHPVRPFFFVATQKIVRVYDLAKQELVKKLHSNSKWISSIAIHPGGDNLLVGTYDRKMLWFDLDLSTKPYQTLRLHGTAVRGVAYHRQYPLFASGSDDRSLIVCHGMVYNDLLQNPLIVPLKRLSNHESYNDFGIFDVIFHPTQPWVFSSGADKTIRLYT